jgi:hypothetical protein
MRQLRILLTAVAFAAALLSPAAALAGTFSRPIPLPSNATWEGFAVNDRGEVVGVGSPKAASGSLAILQVGPGRRTTESALAVPGGLRADVSGGRSVALSAAGEVVVGLKAFDPLIPASDEYHGGGGCCSLAGVAAWRLGMAPPPAQLLTPVEVPTTGYEHDVEESPLVVAGPRSATALWVEGPECEAGVCPGNSVVQAFATYGDPFRSATVLASPRAGIVDLALEPDGRPVASWTEEPKRIRTALGSRTGALGTPAAPTAIPAFESPANRIDYPVQPYFAHDTHGDTLFAYLSGGLGPKRLRLLTSREGGRFGDNLLIHGESETAYERLIAAGGHGRVLIAFDAGSGRGPEAMQVLLGTVGGAFGRPLFVYANSVWGSVDSRGRTLLIADEGETEASTVTARVADPGEGFGPPRRLGRGLGSCQFGVTEVWLGGGEEELGTSPDGNAALLLSCRNGRQYLIRYTP